MTSQPLRRSPRLAAKTAKKVNAATTTTPRSTMPPSILRASKTASARRSSSQPSSMSRKGLPMGVVVKFGRNAAAKFEKENPPYEFEPLDDGDVEELFPLPQHTDDLVVNANANTTTANDNTTATVTPSAIIEEEETRRNEEILSEWEELFDDLTYHRHNRHGNDDDSGDTDDSEGGSTSDSGHDNEEYDHHHRYYSGATTTTHETKCSSSSDYVVVKEEEIDYYEYALPSIASYNASDRPLLEGEKNVMMPVMRVDVYYCDFCMRGVRRTSEYFYEWDSFYYLRCRSVLPLWSTRKHEVDIKSVAIQPGTDGINNK